jgi:PKD repeat protein
MRLITLGLCALLCSFFSFSQQYSRVKIYSDAEGLSRLSQLGVTVDHGTYKQNTFFISDFSDREISIMQENGFSFEVLIDDVQKYYVEQNLLKKEPAQKNVSCSGTGGGGTSGFSPATPSNFNLGTMGGYLKYNEMLAELDAMAAQYPTLISAKAQISTYLTHESRPIYHVKISDNPNSDESGEPNVLYTAIHHAREPMSMMETIFYMWYLLENYSTNDEVKYLVDNMQMYFVPCINPDGYVYNETTNPNGGGMHRKNRRNVGTTNKGVDLNRNYSYGFNTTGVSSNQNNDTYPGTAAFSEPETQAIRWLVQNHSFTTAFNAHAFAESILFPIGTTTAEFAPRHDWFQDETNHMVQYNGYTGMKSSALYPASGDSDDYMYKSDVGVGLKDTIMAHTPEVGTDFWQPSSEIEATCQEMVFPNLVLAHLTRKYLVVQDTDPASIATTSGNFNHSAQRLGLEDGAVTVSIEPLLNIASVGAPVVYDIPCRTVASGSISYTLSPSIQFGDLVKYILKTDNGLWVKKDTIVKTYGALTLQALEDATATTNWTGTWTTTTSTYVSATKSFTEGQTGNYSNNSTKTYAYVPTIDLTNATAAMISYYAKWALETDYDYVQFQVSTDGGTTWIGQCTNYTVLGTSANGSVQPNNQPVYEGTQSLWVLDEINLSDYLGQSIKVRFKFQSDGGTTADGFYFDDFKVMYNEAGPVSVPVASFTTSQTTTCSGSSIIFNDFSTNIPTSWSWDFGDGTTSTDQSPSHTYATSGIYTVSLTVTNSAGSDTQTMTDYITVNAAPSVTLSTSDADNTVCVYSGLVTLVPTPSGSILYGPGVSGTSFDPASSFAGIGTWYVIASYTDGNGCQDSASVAITVDACLSLGEDENSKIQIYPNPNEGIFVVSGLEINGSVEILDINGKLIYKANAIGSKLEVKMPEVSSGVYYLTTYVGGLPKRYRLALM